MTVQPAKESRRFSAWLLLALMAVWAAIGQASAPDDPCPPPEQCWTTQDVIDEHVDHHAQSVMMGMMDRGGEEGVDASSMLCAAKRGYIEGIYIAETAAPISRAKSVGSNWWEMIPTGKNWACYRRPPERPPMIVFRRQIQDQRPVLAAALREAWRVCGTTTVARCYTVTLTRPSDPSMEDGIWARKGDSVVDPGNSSRCSLQWSCEPAAVFSEGITDPRAVPNVVVVEKTEDKTTEGSCVTNPLDGYCICTAPEPEEPCKFRWGARQGSSTVGGA